jgi:hypothetical protein
MHPLIRLRLKWIAALRGAKKARELGKPELAARFEAIANQYELAAVAKRYAINTPPKSKIPPKGWGS